MISRGARTLAAVAVILAIILVNSVFIVSETEQVVITQLGRPIGQPVTQAGLYFKVPILQKANFFEKRIMKWGWESQSDSHAGQKIYLGGHHRAVEDQGSSAVP